MQMMQTTTTIRPEDDITILLPTRNEEKNIGRFLSHLPPHLPLIVVDASTDRTPQIIREMRPDANIIRRRSTVTEAREIGYKQAKTSWLLFTDADVRFPENYWETLYTYLRHGDKYSVVYGTKSSSDQYHEYYEFFRHAQQFFHNLGISAATGSNLVIRKEVLEAVDGFDMRLTCNEDTEVVWRIMRRSYPVVFVPDLKVYAYDHRRLDRGTIKKSIHSTLRCFMIFSGMFPDSWISYDFGYWNPVKKKKKPVFLKK